MIHTDTMELIIKNQQEQIKGLPETNRTLVESNQKLMKQTGELQQKVQELLSQVVWLNRQLSAERVKSRHPWIPTGLPCLIPWLIPGKRKRILWRLA